MAVGGNLDYGGSQNALWSLFNKYLNHKKNTLRNLKAKIAQKAGVPASNTAADNPNAKYDFVIDTTNKDIYICTAWTADASATTWLKITD